MNRPLQVDTNTQTESFAETLMVATQKLNQLLGKKLDPETLYPTLANNIEALVTPSLIRALCEAWQTAIAGPTNARETLIDLGLNFTRNLFEIYAQIAAHLDTAAPLAGKPKPSSEALTAVAQRTQIFVRTAVATGWHIKWSMLRRTSADPMLIRAICALILHIEQQAAAHDITGYRRLLLTARVSVEQELMSLALLTLAAPESLTSHQIGLIDDLIRHRLHSLSFSELNGVPSALAHIELSSGQISRHSPSKPGAQLFIPLAQALDKLATILANEGLPASTRQLYEQLQTRWRPPGERLHREVTLIQGWLAWGFSAIIRSERQHAWDTPQHSTTLRRCLSLDSNESGRKIWIRNTINLDLQPGTLIAFSEDITGLRRLATVSWIRRDNAVGIEVGIRILAASYTTSPLSHIATDGRIIHNYHNEYAILPEALLSGPQKIDLILSSGNAPTALALPESKLLLLHQSNTRNGYDHSHERYHIAPRLVR